MKSGKANIRSSFWIVVGFSIVILTRYIWLPLLLKQVVYINPIISFRLHDCQIDSISYDLPASNSGTGSRWKLLLGDVSQMTFYCMNKKSSKLGVAYHFNFSIDGSGRLKDWGSAGAIDLNTKISSIIRRIESCDALSEIIQKNNLRDARLGYLSKFQEAHPIAAQYSNAISDVFWSDCSKKLFLSNLPWKNYKYLPGHASSLTKLKDDQVVLGENDTILAGDYSPIENSYRYRVAMSSCGGDILVAECDDGKDVNHGWIAKTDTVTIDSLGSKALGIIATHGIGRRYINEHLTLVQAKALRSPTHSYINGRYIDKSALWARFMYHWSTGIRLIDTMNTTGLLLRVYFIYTPSTDSIEMIRIGTSTINFSEKIALKEIDKDKYNYIRNYVKNQKRIPNKNTYLQLSGNGDCVIKWGGLLDGGTLNLQTGVFNLVERGGMFCLMPDDMARYGTVDSRFPIHSINK